MLLTKLHRRIRQAIKSASIYGFLLMLLCGSMTGYGQQERSPGRGYQSAASYALSDIETINTTNGNLMLSIPLASLPTGRGGHPGYTLYLHYNSKLWNSKHENRLGGLSHPDNLSFRYGIDLLEPSDEGGWRFGLYYQLQLINRIDLEAAQPEQPCSTSEMFLKNQYIWKLQMTFPDGSVHEFRPAGYIDHFNDGFYDINPDGVKKQVSISTIGDGTCSDTAALVPTVSTGMTYYSTDGTFMRLEVQHSGDGNGSNNPWTLYFPDGRKVEENRTPQTGYNQKQYDRNNNYVTVSNGTVTDQLGRSITMFSGPQGDIIRTKGVGGENVDTIIKGRANWVYHNYTADADVNAPQAERNQTIRTDLGGIDEIILPAQAGSLKYKFGYSGKAAEPGEGDYSDGFGELNSITLPSGAKAAYAYLWDGAQNQTFTSDIIKNSPTRKDLTYNLEYDGTSTPTTERWFYNISSFMSTIKAPDEGVTTDYFISNTPAPGSTLSYKTVHPDGTVVERIWASNTPSSYGVNANNFYIKTEFTSIADAAGHPVKTAIKDYSYDKNGNLIQVKEYDWINYSELESVRSNGRITAIPQSAESKLKRIVTNTYYNQAPDAASTTGSNLTYDNKSARRVLNLLKSTEISDNSQALSRTELYYDNENTTANLIERRSWDSVKAPVLPTGGLSSANAVIVKYEYGPFGNLILTTDANGNKTEYTYGNIPGPNGVVFDLYPTQIRTALGTSVQRTAAQEFDYYTGVVTKVTDVDNGVSTVTQVDVFGRPTRVIAAAGTSVETHGRTIYNDAERRVVVKADLNTAGDGKLVTIKHLDQLGRVRLIRQLEDAATQSEADETAGIKVQTRYKYSGTHSYQVTSNPYRAAYSSQAGGEPEMGWRLTKSAWGGRIVAVQAYSGYTLPAPWGGNTSSTGTVSTLYDAASTTVTDQAQRVRRSETDALGRLIKVVEDPQGLNYQTTYNYDGLSNLVQVVQGTQTRSFSYSSLSRLVAAQNPEIGQNGNGSLHYTYDDNGNLISRTDPRQITTQYFYDALNRVTLRHYSDGVTPDVAYLYDTLNFGKGRLTSVSSSISLTSYTGYDALGRITGSTQVTSGQTYTMPEYKFNLAGGLTSETYPSGRVVTTEFDSAGRLSAVAGQKPGEALKAYTDSYTYTAHGAIKSLRLGNNLWEQTVHNTRLQPTRIALGVSATDASKLQLDYSYGTTNNNGNVQSQSITLPGLSLVQSYTYDELNRLKTMTETGGLLQEFDYDRYGNRAVTAGFVKQQSTALTLQSLTSYNQDNNRIANVNYDAAGNLMSAVAGHLFTYDAENKMIAHDDVQTVGVVDNRYFYDGVGQRVKKITGSVTTIYVYDIMGRMVAEYSDSNASSQTSGTSYLTADSLGTPRVITNSQGAVISRHDYLPFGEEISAGTGGRTIALGYVEDDVKQKFTGKERDDETGLDYFNARYYSSGQGRFTSADPVMVTPERFFDPQQFNLYGYTRNNPLKFIDPTGEQLIISGDVNEIKKQLAAMIGTDDAAKRINFDEKTGIITIDLNGIDLSENEGANLLNDVISSTRVYSLTVGSSMETLGGQLQLTPTEKNGYATMANLDNNSDDRFPKGKSDTQKPPKGVDSQIGINYDFRSKNSESTTQLELAPDWTTTFHELAEAYAKVESSKQYAEAHQKAIDRETRLRDQRPYLKKYNPGSGPGTSIIIRNK